MPRVVAARALVCLALLIAAGAQPPTAAGQSLAEVARREQERRKAVRGSSKVYTNRDLGSGATAPPPAVSTPGGDAAQTGQAATPAAPGGVGAAAAGASGGPAAGQGAAGAAEAQASPDPTKTEQYWRERITSARAALERSELFLEALQSRVNALTTDFVNRDDPAQRAVIANDRQRALAEMERVRREIETLKAEIAAIHEEARKAGVPPGWLR
jgi:hypothetical protein